MKRAIVTGATGFIGSWLIDELSNNGIEAIAVIRPNSSNLGRIKKHKLIKIIELSLDDIDQLPKHIDNADTFYHLGWEGVTLKERNNSNLQRKNIKRTVEAVKLSAEIGCKTWVGTGSQAEYGLVNNRIFINSPTKPISAYGKAKLSAYCLSRAEAEKKKINHSWVRIFSVYGGGDDQNTLISSTIRSLLMGTSHPLTKGEQLWDFLYIADAVSALRVIGEGNGGLFNLGSGEVRKISEYLSQIRDYINPEIKLRLGELAYGENQIMHLEADITELKRLGWKPQTNFEEGIKATIAWHRRENI